MPIESELLQRAAALAASLVQDTVGLFTDASSRTHWPFLLTAGLAALAFAVFGPRRGLSVRAVLRRWMSASARVDYALAILRPVVSATLIAPWLASAFAVAAATAIGLERAFGSAPQVGLPPLVVTVVFTIVLFVAWDLSRFALHLAMHRVPVLWQFHQVHHSAETLNPLTLYRVHPVERALFAVRAVLVTGCLTGGFYYAFGGAAVQAELLGVNAVGAVFNAVGGNLRHSHVRWGWGPLEAWFISPAQHQIHHQRFEDGAVGSRDGHELNYGTWLALWDRLLGTLVHSRDVTAGPFGLPDGVRNHRPDRLLSALFDPVWAVLGVGTGGNAKVKASPAAQPGSRPSPG